MRKPNLPKHRRVGEGLCVSQNSLCEKLGGEGAEAYEGAWGRAVTRECGKTTLPSCADGRVHCPERQNRTAIIA